MIAAVMDGETTITAVTATVALAMEVADLTTATSVRMEGDEAIDTMIALPSIVTHPVKSAMLVVEEGVSTMIATIAAVRQPPSQLSRHLQETMLLADNSIALMTGTPVVADLID